MKKILALICIIVVVASLVAFGLTLFQVEKQEAALLDDLNRRTGLLADSFKEAIRPSYLNSATSTTQGVLDKFAGRERLLGLTVHDNKGALFAASTDLSAELIDNNRVAEKAMDADTVLDDFFLNKGSTVYVYSTPLRENGKVIGALTVLQRADYIQSSVWETWKNSLIRLILQIIVFSLAAILILHWFIYKPLLRITELIRQARTGEAIDDFSVQKNSGFLKPLSKEISKITRSLVLARGMASEEAKLRLEKIDSPWTAERLKEFFKAYLKDRQIFVVSNREPYSHKKVKNKIVWDVPASGMVTALEPVMEACGGLWLAHGSGEADKQMVDLNDKIQVPPDNPKYTLKRVWLTKQEVDGYYVGFSNEALWPLCHTAHTRPKFRQEDWLEYKRVNGKFAEILLAEIKNVPRPVILIQDYHFALLPKIIKKSRPDAEIGLFWHIPWPNAEIFSICPWRKEILKGMLGADVLGFHTQQHCNNFLETVNKEIESLADLEKFTITHENHTTSIKPFPISVPFVGSDTVIKKSESTLLKKLELSSSLLGVGVDRLDYTKGILERFKGLDFFFEKYPKFQEEFTFIQIAAPSREDVEKYRQFNDEVTREAERVNKKYEKNDWKPIILIKEQLSHQEIAPLYREANVCLVTSLSDGMNLVAKEYVAARHDEAGVLVLSQFTGAARDLKGAITINPYSAEETAEAILDALVMPVSEQHRRMKKMRQSIKDYNIYRWAAEFLKSINSLS